MTITEELKRQIWEKATPVDGYDKNLYRKDSCGAWISYEQFENSKSDLGWEIDHIYPKSKLLELGIREDLIDNITNLRPLHWKNNRSKSDDYPNYMQSMRSEGDINIDVNIERSVNHKTQDKIKEFFEI